MSDVTDLVDAQIAAYRNRFQPDDHRGLRGR